MFHRLPLHCAGRAAALNGIPVVSLLVPCCRQRSRLTLQSKTVLAFVGPNINAVNAPLDWCKTAWEATARNLLLPGKVQNATYAFKCRPQPGAPGPAALPDPSLRVPTEKGTCQAPRCPTTPGLQSPLPFAGPPARPPATHAGHGPGTRRRAGGGTAGAMLLDHPRGTELPAPLGWLGSSSGAGSWGAGELGCRQDLRSQAPPLAVLPAPLPITCQLLRKQPCCSPCAVLLQAKLIISNKPVFKLQNQAGAS